MEVIYSATVKSQYLFFSAYRPLLTQSTTTPFKDACIQPTVLMVPFSSDFTFSYTAAHSTPVSVYQSQLAPSCSVVYYRDQCLGWSYWFCSSLISCRSIWNMVYVVCWFEWCFQHIGYFVLHCLWGLQDLIVEDGDWDSIKLSLCITLL